MNLKDDKSYICKNIKNQKFSNLKKDSNILIKLIQERFTTEVIIEKGYNRRCINKGKIK